MVNVVDHQFVKRKKQDKLTRRESSSCSSFIQARMKEEMKRVGGWRRGMEGKRSGVMRLLSQVSGGDGGTEGRNKRREY